MTDLLTEGLGTVLAYVERDRKRPPPRWKPLTKEQIQSLRAQLGMTQEQFAETYGINLSSLRKWEQGIVEPEQASCLHLNMIQTDPGGVKQLVAKSREIAKS